MTVESDLRTIESWLTDNGMEFDQPGRVDSIHCPPGMWPWASHTEEQLFLEIPVPTRGISRSDLLDSLREATRAAAVDPHMAPELHGALRPEVALLEEDDFIYIGETYRVGVARSESENVVLISSECLDDLSG